MALTKLAVRLDNRDSAYQLAGLLGEICEPAPETVSIFEVDNVWLVDAIFADHGKAESACANISALTDRPLNAAVLCEVEDLNWVALSQAALPPVYAGRFTVFGGHDREQVPRGPFSIMVDAGEAFGTAHHATTYGCLLAIDQLTRRGRFHNVLDLGTGSGVLALALRRALPQSAILATDLDERSIEVADENAALNHAYSLFGGRLRFRVADGLGDAQIRAARMFDLAVANILAGPLTQMSGDIAKVMRRGGHLVLSGILDEQAPSVVAAYNAHGFCLRRHARIDDWSTLTMQKRR